MDLLLRQSTLGSRLASRRLAARNLPKLQQRQQRRPRNIGPVISHHLSTLAVNNATMKPLQLRLQLQPQLCGTRRPRSSSYAACLSTVATIGRTAEDPTVEVNETSTVAAAVYFEVDEPLSLEDSADMPESVRKYDLSTLHEKTSHYLDLERFPLGSMDLEAFEEAREIVWAWSDLGTPISVEHSFELLSRLVEEQGSNFHSDLSERKVGELLNCATLTTVVRNWYTCFQEQDETLLESTTTTYSHDFLSPQEVLSKIEKMAVLCPSLGPQTKAFAIIMRAVVYRIKTVEEAQYVESLLMKMVKGFQAGDNRMTPTIAEYNIVLSAMAKVKEPERAEAILARLCDDFESGLSRLVPNEFSFGTVLFAWAHAKHSDGSRRAEAVLDTMIALGRQEEDSLLAFPSGRCYHNVLLSMCGPKTQVGTSQAEQFLKRMNEDFQTGNENARPTAASYGLIIHNWSQLGYAEESEAMIRSMYNDYDQNGNELAKLTSYQFNSAISAWQRSGDPNALERAFSLFDNMQKLEITPDAATFGVLMTTLSRSKNPSAGEKAESILREQQAQYNAGNEDSKPDAMHYNAVMHCWSSVGNATRAAALLRELLEEHKKADSRIITDERPFITVFAALARSRVPTSAEEAEVLFLEMTRLCEAGEFDFQPSAVCYAALQGCWASVEQPVSGEKCLALLHEMNEKYAVGNKGMRSTEANYKIVIDAFARIRNPQAAEEVWFQMLQGFLDGNPDAKPGVDSCKAVLAAWLMSGTSDAIQRTVDVIERIAEVDRSGAIELKVDRNAYYLLLDICSKAENPDILAGAETIIRKMEEVHNEGRNTVGPDTRCYNIAINCWGKHGSADRAEVLFWDMYNKFIKNGNQQVKPDVFTVSTVLTAWRRSGNENATRRAQVFFERIHKLIDMGKLDMKLDSACYAALLNCLANAQTGEAADAAESIVLDIAQKYRGTNDKSIRPTHQLYYAFIKCLANVGRLEKAEEILMEMNDLYHTTRWRDLEPKKHFFSLVLNGWFKSGGENAPARAEKLLRWMDSNLQRNERPDASNYALLLRCWSRSRLPTSGKRSEALLYEMAERFGAHRPIVKDCYADVVCALARSGDVERADELLVHMSEEFTKHKKGVHPATPHMRAFISVLGAYSKESPSGSLGLRVVKIVQILRDVDVDEKTRWRFNSVLAVWDKMSQDVPADTRVTSFLANMDQLDCLADGQGVSTDQKEEKADPYLSIKY